MTIIYSLSSAADLWKAIENFSVEIRNNSMKAIPTECLTPNFIPIKFKELQVKKQ
jgi:hypothetical protein